MVYDPSLFGFFNLFFVFTGYTGYTGYQSQWSTGSALLSTIPAVITAAL